MGTPIDAPFGEVAVVPLAALAVPSGATARDFCVRSGRPVAAAVLNGSMYVLPGSDYGQDQTIEILGNGQDTASLVRFRSKSDPNRRFEVVTHGDGQGRTERSSHSIRLGQLRVRGIGRGELGKMDAAFGIDGVTTLDPLASSATIEVRSTGEIVNLATLWSFNKESNTFIIPRAKMVELLRALPNEELPFSLGLVTADGNKAGVFEILVAKDEATITIQSPSRPAVVNRAGRRVLVLTGEDNNVRRAGSFGAGPIRFDKLPAGQYRILALADDFELKPLGWVTLAQDAKQTESTVDPIPELDLRTRGIGRCGVR